MSMLMFMRMRMRPMRDPVRLCACCVPERVFPAVVV